MVTDAVMSQRQNPAPVRPASDVSSAVGLVGLAGLFAWVAFARGFPDIAAAFDWPVPRDTLGGKNSALVGLLAAAVPMAAWSIIVDKVHLRPSTGIDWSLRRTRQPDPRPPAARTPCGAASPRHGLC